MVTYDPREIEFQCCNCGNKWEGYNDLDNPINAETCPKCGEDEDIEIN